MVHQNFDVVLQKHALALLDLHRAGGTGGTPGGPGFPCPTRKIRGSISDPASPEVLAAMHSHHHMTKHRLMSQILDSILDVIHTRVFPSWL